MRIISLLLLVLLAACESVVPAEVALPNSAAKQLATVYISPTPNPAQVQATETALAGFVTPSPTPEILATPTVYVGVFLEPGPDVDALPLVNATLAAAGSLVVATERPSRCQVPIDAAFGENWRTNLELERQLGCAVEVMNPFDGTVQLFERGIMFFQPNGPVWAVASSGSIGGPYWSLAQQLPGVSEVDQVTPPPGLYAPLLGFGSVWYGVDGVRDALGYARTEEQETRISYQRFEGGTLIADVGNGVVYVLLNNNRAFGPYETND